MDKIEPDTNREALTADLSFKNSSNTLAKITLFGAAREVTGSCYLIETESARVLVDCGMFQGSKRLELLNRIPTALKKQKIDCVILSHGHLDHCGRLPLLCAEGFIGPIYATAASKDIAELILFDAAKIQRDDIERENRKRKRVGLEPLKALFTQKDVERVCRQFRLLDYDQWKEICPGVKVKLVEAGHILGSSSIQLNIYNKHESRTLIFSGDLGQWDAPIMKDPAQIDDADMVFLESTYGNREHRSIAETVEEFEELIKTAVKNKGKILIPTFAVGRTQQVLYHLGKMFRSGAIPRFPVYLDSPMAIAATDLYAKHRILMDEEAQGLAKSGQAIGNISDLKLCITPDESRALNSVSGPCIILAGAGMCNAGRILHHFRHNLELPDTVVIIVGYQTRGSLGRQLIEGAQRVKIFGETIHVNATVKSLGGFSAHGGQSDLLRWLAPMAKNGARIVLTHGEAHSITEFSQKIRSEFGLSPESPKLGDTLFI